jgi:hypothetical protein
MFKVDNMPQKVSWPRPNGLAYEFEVYPLGTQFREVSGIYVFCRLTSTGWQPIYLGQAIDLNQRVGVGLKHHHAYPGSFKAGATHVCVMPVQSAAQRNAIERELCSHLRPSVNQQLVR